MSLGRAISKWWLNRVANTAILMKRTSRAIEAYREILAIDPDDIYARTVLGNLLADDGQQPLAEREFETLVERHPNNAEGWFNLGFLFDKRDALPEAERAFRRAVELRPSIDRAWYGLGLVLVRAGRLREATTAFERAVKLQPMGPYAYYQLGMTYHHLGERERALEVHRRLAEFEPKFSATLKRDLEQTTPLSAGVAPVSNDFPQKEDMTQQHHPFKETEAHDKEKR